jgi:putative flippase GtrA
MNTYKDYRIAAIAGFFTGVFLLPILYNLSFLLPYGIPRFILLIIMPIVWMAGIFLGAVLSRWLRIMAQFSRYVAAGFLSFAIDFGIFNTLILFTGIVSGGWLAGFKGASYVFANINAYLWNKFWVFRRYTPGEPLTMRSVLGEYGKFLIVSIIGFIINVSITSFIVDIIGPRFGFGSVAWANIAAVAATAIAVIWNFAGYKLFVFRKQSRHTVLASDTISDEVLP